TLTNKLETSKSFKPIKLKVDIDIKGSANVIKSQLDELGKAIDGFNSKFGKQIEMLSGLNQKLNQEKQKAQQTMNQGITSGGAGVDSFGTKQYIAQLRDVETEMRKVFGKSGNFSSFEFKDAEGNL